MVLDRDPDFGTPHFVRRRSSFLSPPAPGSTPQQIVSALIEANARTFTLHPTDLQPPNARVTQDYATTHNGMRHVRWQQQKDGIDIYGATFALNLTKANEIVNVSSRTLHIPEIRFHRIEKTTKDEAIRIAEEHLGAQNPKPETRNLKPSLVWFPLDQISAVLSWDLLAEAPDGSTHRLIVRADTGTVVEDLNLTWSLEPITMRVYTSDSPTPFSPGMSEPTNCTPPTVTQELFTITVLDTNASPQGWVPDGSNELLGNNAETYDDRHDANTQTGLWQTGFPYRQFGVNTYVDPSPERQAFYWANVFHDRLYQFGFDEAAGNFQEDNFGRGGRDADRMRIEVWNGAVAPPIGQYNQANITVLNDGNQPRMQLYLWNLSGANRDSALDAEVIFHEAAHGVSARLIGDGYGLSTVQSRGMGEGWSDFMALSLLSEPGDDVHGCYALGAYVNARADWTNNYYFGIRRFPYTTDTNKAPQTLADTDPNQMVFPPEVPTSPKVETLEADEVHRVGETWALALWECRANLMETLGFAGNGTMLQLVVDGMKLTPVNPTFTQARDAILLADQVNNGGVNQLALWRGFAKRGLGYSATVPASPSTVGIVEAFDLPLGVAVQIAEAGGDGDGYVEPGEGADLVIVLTSHELDLLNLTATLTAASSNVTLTASNAVLPDVIVGNSTTSAPPFAFSVDAGFPGFTDTAFSLRIESDQGWFREPILIRIGNPYDYPPEILNITVTNVTETNAWVAWTTDIPTAGQVIYGVTTNYGQSTIPDPDMRTNHLAELTVLAKGTVYHVRIHAEGTNGLPAASDDFTFRTRARIYVNSNSTTTQELGTIAAPFKTLQAAAEAANATGDEILVARGTYTGTSPEAVLDLNGAGWNLVVRGGYSDDFSVCDPKVYETVIDGERQRRGIWLDNGATLAISGVTITRGEHQWGGAIGVRKSSFRSENCTIIGNTSTTGMNEYGGGVYGTLGASMFLDHCTVSGNSSGLRGGGVFAVSTDTYVTLKCCNVVSNRALTGGGIYVQGGAQAEVLSCQIALNVAQLRGGGMDVSPFATVSLVFSTISSNLVIQASDPNTSGGGGVSVAGSLSTANLMMNNSIVYGNISDYGGSDLLCAELSDVHVAYSDIGDIYGGLTSSNHLLRVDPLFANSAAGDFHLLYGSPCIDTGEPGAGGDMDMDGEPRPFGAAIDIGADEFTDADGDHMADYWEVQTFGSVTNRNGTASDDHDGLDDFNEYLNQTDPFDPDSDGDLAQDGWEVANGYVPTNPDQDGDGMWDGWEVLHALNAFTNDATLDPDGDTANNQAEFTADTDPHDSNSVLCFLAFGEQWGGTRLDWQGGRDAWQYLETSTDLPTTNWAAIYGVPPPTPITNAVIHLGTTNQILFYRIRALR